LVAQEAKVASFLLQKGIALNDEAMGLLLDVVEDNLLLAFVRLEALARGVYSPDATLEAFPTYVTNKERLRPSIECSSLFEKMAI
jgi:hypothetical protein